MENSTKAQLANRYFFQKGQRASDDYNQFWIRYKPERVVRKTFGGTETVRFCALVIASVLCWLCVQHQLIPLIPFILLGLLAVEITKLQFIAFPTHISFSEQGMQLHWLRSICNVSSATIPWDTLTHVSIGKSKFLGSPQKMLEFNLAGPSIELHGKQKYALIPLSAGWLAPGRRKISLALNGIASSDDKKRLQLALKKFLPAYRIEPAVSDELNLALRVETYTDLWLDVLHSSARLRHDQLAAGDKVNRGQYDIVCEFASGGQAIVYEALDRGVNRDANAVPREVVLKEFVLPTHAGTAVRKRVLENIQREAELLKELKHPNVVRLLDFFVDDERAYLVLERIRGLTLKQLIEEKGPMREEQVVMLGLQMCEILGYLHAHKVVHRDFTPDNLILGHGDILKLIDFNVAQQREGDSVKSVVGKHAYIPPEQFRGKAGQQSDLYAAGGTLFFLLTGKEPEPITRSKPRSVREEISVDMNEIVWKATALGVDLRYSSCIELRNDLQELKTRYTS